MRLLQETRREGLKARRWKEEAAPSWSVRSAHDGLELAWSVGGALSYRVGDDELVVPRGGCVVIPAGVRHQTLLGGGAVASAVHLGEATLDRLGQELGPRALRALLGPGLAFAAGPLEALALATGHLTPGAESPLCEALVLEVLLARRRSVSLEQARDRRLAQALELVWARFREDLDVAALARAARMSRAHFSRAFTRRLGTSPYRFLLELRLREASELLLRPELGVTEAALRAGFTDLSRFGVQFRHRFGCSPREYRLRPPAPQRVLP